MGRVPTRPQPPTSQEHTIGTSTLAPITGQVFRITAPLLGQYHNQSCIVTCPVKEINKHVTHLHNHKSFRAAFGRLHQDATAFQWTSMMEFHHFCRLFWAFGSCTGRTEKLANILWLVWVRRQRKKVVLGVKFEFHFNTHAHTPLLSEAKTRLMASLHSARLGVKIKGVKI